MPEAGKGRVGSGRRICRAGGDLRVGGGLLGVEDVECSFLNGVGVAI